MVSPGCNLNTTAFSFNADHNKIKFPNSFAGKVCIRMKYDSFHGLVNLEGNCKKAILGTLGQCIVGIRDFNYTGSEVWKKENGKFISYIECHNVRVPIAPERACMLLGVSSIEELCSQEGCWIVYICGFLY
jgi:hypothetical protein